MIVCGETMSEESIHGSDENLEIQGRKGEKFTTFTLLSFGSQEILAELPVSSNHG